MTSQSFHSEWGMAGDKKTLGTKLKNYNVFMQ